MKNSKLARIVVLLCLLGSALLSQAAPDPNFHIYICWGQSNMEGNATVPNSEKSGVSDRFQLLYSADNCGQCNRRKGAWMTATPPLARCFHWNNAGFGPIDYFGRTLVEKLDPSIKVGVIVVACGGADIQLFEKDRYQAYLSSCADWLKGYANSYGGNPYGRIIEMAKKAQQEGVIKGILVHQGETNNMQATWPGRLKAIYENMLTDLNLKASEVPLLVGETRRDGACRGHNDIIKTVPNTIPTAYVVSSEGCQAANDEFHFTVEGYKKLGQNYANVMLDYFDKNGGLQKDLLIATTIQKEDEPGEVNISVSVENNNIQRVDIYADDQLIAPNQKNFTWENVKKGAHKIWAVGYDASNREYKSAVTEISIFEEQRPYNGTPAKIPGKIEAEEFDYGGEGNAYHDKDEVNHNEGTLRDEGVDMSNTAIGYTQVGEWIEYTVEIEEEGEYVVESRVASGADGSQFTLYLDNQFIIPGSDGTPGGFVDVPNTGDWSLYTNVSTKLNRLSKGVHVLKIEITGDWVDLDYLKFDLLKSDQTGVKQIASDKNRIADGDYNVYDATGRFINVISIRNAYSDQLKAGFYILKNAEGETYPMIIK
ncbi:MAG: carbohydrate-binding protein [Paludibacteraceae bacterium]|nr:carbohydrate-binding protein [Paludibacteraceae bacterium]